jgi:hypothetical protein
MLDAKRRQFIAIAAFTMHRSIEKGVEQGMPLFIGERKIDQGHWMCCFLCDTWWPVSGLD